MDGKIEDSWKAHIVARIAKQYFWSVDSCSVHRVYAHYTCYHSVIWFSILNLCPFDQGGNHRAGPISWTGQAHGFVLRSTMEYSFLRWLIFSKRFRMISVHPSTERVILPVRRSRAYFFLMRHSRWECIRLVVISAEVGRVHWCCH